MCGRSEGYGSWSLCVSVKSHLTSGASVCPKNTVTYLADGKRGQNICVVFSDTIPLQRSSTPSYVQSAIFLRKATIPIIVHVFTTCGGKGSTV